MRIRQIDVHFSVLKIFILFTFHYFRNFVSSSADSLFVLRICATFVIVIPAPIRKLITVNTGKTSVGNV